MQQLSVAPGDKWTAAIIITKQGLKPEAKVFSYFFEARNYKAAATMINCSKEKEELHYKGKNFRRSIKPHHKFNKKQNKVVALVRVQRFILHMWMFLCAER